MNPAHPDVEFDARPLTEPVDRRAVAAFLKQQRRSAGGGFGAAIVVVILVVILSTTALPVMVEILGDLADDGRASGIVMVVLFLAVAVGAALIAYFSYRQRRVARYRLHRFAEANGMVYEDRVAAPRLPGMIFHVGSSRFASQIVRGSSPRFVEFGNYEYTTGSGKNRKTHRWGYVAIRLDVPLPNIVLDAVGNNSVFGSNLPASIRSDQRLSLEGDFDRYFELYCPTGYERDALYLFTPDIMARFVDRAAELDVEIVDDWMFLYTRREVSTIRPENWTWLFGVVGALTVKLDQWARWRDDRLAAPSVDAEAADPSDRTRDRLPFAAPAGMITPPPGVAREGRRLSRRQSWLPLAIVVVIGVVWVWMSGR